MAQVQETEDSEQTGSGDRRIGADRIGGQEAHSGQDQGDIRSQKTRSGDRHTHRVHARDRRLRVGRIRSRLSLEESRLTSGQNQGTGDSQWAGSTESIQQARDK